MQEDSKKVRNSLMVDVEIAITNAMPWRMNTMSYVTPREYIKLAMVKIRSIIIPAMESDDCKIRDQAREIYCNEELIEELSSRVDELEAEETEREGEAEHMALVKMFYDNTNKRKESRQ